MSSALLEQTFEEAVVSFEPFPALLAAAPPVAPTAALAALNPQIEAMLRERITSLPAMTEEELLDAGRAATQMIACGYVIRGACALELQKRAPKALTGRGNKDENGMGRTAQFRELASRFDVSARTLYDDARIYETFFAPRLMPTGEEGEEMPEQELLNRLPYGSLGRDHYRLALSAKTNPIQQEPVDFLLDMTQRNEGACTVQDIRERLSSYLPMKWGTVEKGNVAISLATIERLKELMERHNQVKSTYIRSLSDYVTHLAGLEARRLRMETKREAAAPDDETLRHHEYEQAALPAGD